MCHFCTNMESVLEELMLHSQCSSTKVWAKPGWAITGGLGDLAALFPFPCYPGVSYSCPRVLPQGDIHFMVAILGDWYYLQQFPFYVFSHAKHFLVDYNISQSSWIAHCGVHFIKGSSLLYMNSIVDPVAMHILMIIHYELLSMYV